MKLALVFLATISLVPIVRAADPPDVQVVLGDVKDNRSTGHSFVGLEVEMKLIGDILDDAVARRALVKTAMDDTGRNLLDPEKSETDFQMENFGEKGRITLKLKNPARKAQVIKELTGQVELLVPKNDPQATISVEDLPKKVGTPIDAPALKSAGIELTLWTREQYEAMRQKKINENQKEAEGVVGAEIAKSLKQFFEGFSSIGANDITMQVKDPNDKLVGMEFRDGDKKIPHEGRSSMGRKPEQMISYHFKTKIPDSARLVIYVGTPKATVSAPFSLLNTVLP